MYAHLIVSITVALALISSASISAAEGRDQSLRNSATVGLNFQGVGRNDPENDTGLGETYTTGINIGMGHFVTDNIEIGGSFSLSISTSDIGSDSESRTIGIMANSKYHFAPFSRTCPYLGPQCGLSGNSFSDDSGIYQSDSSFGLGYMAGINFFNSNNAAMYLEYNFLWTPLDILRRTIYVFDHKVNLGVTKYF
jgi:opacity protein-like surface antigen